MKNNTPLCGIDEAGRGCLAGPMVVAGVILDKMVPGLNDSKKLTPQKRESLYEAIIENSRYHICIIEPDEIDTRGISATLKGALLEIMATLPTDDFLFDGNSSYGISGLRHLIKADSQVEQVAAASILAKVTKDRRLIEAGAAYPQFDFASHQGYGTKKHIEEIRQYGLTTLHRKSYKLKSIQQPSLF
jgi:ribonuclease HII